MQVSDKAQTKLAGMLGRAGPKYHGFRLEGYVGACHASIPLLRLAAGPGRRDSEVRFGNIRIWVTHAIQDRMQDAAIDYETTLFKRGFSLSLPQCSTCECGRS